MDDNTGNDDARQSLFDEFESEIVKAGNSEAFFDENDLVEIFDYASDLDNYIVKMEVLLYGARHYPDSESLATRRAWFYSSFGEMEAAAQVNRRVSHEGVLNKLLSLRAEGASATPETRARLDEIVGATEEFGDEDVIQLVDFCAELEMLDWVRDNREAVVRRTPYPQTFIYEYADRAEDAGDYDTAAALFEELTMMEPFTLDFWLRLSATEYARKNFDASLSAADYALAISPDNIEAISLKAKSLYWLDRDLPGVITSLRELVKRPDANEDDIRILSFALNDMRDNAGAVEVIRGYLDNHPPTRTVMDCLLTLDISEGERYARQFFTERDVDELSYLNWAYSHFKLKNYEIAAVLMKIVAEHNVTFEAVNHLVEAYYLAGRYEEAIEAFGKFIGKKIHYPCVALPYIMSLVRLGRREEALKEVNDFLSHSRVMIPLIKTRGDEASPFEFNCMQTGHYYYLDNIRRALEAPGELPADDFDPACL